MEKGKKKWVRIINNICMYMPCYIRVSITLKMEAGQVNQKSLRIGIFL